MGVRAVWEGLLDLLAPHRCCACDGVLSLGASASGAGFCEACAPLVEPCEDRGAATLYGGPMADAIKRLKYGGRGELAAPLGRRLAAAALSFAGEVDAVIPVPLHARRLRARGYNQAALLARPVAAVLAIPLETRVLVRARDTPPQAGLDAAGRLANVRAAFRVDRSAPRRVLLIDDVRTTGSTLAACAEALREEGAERVHPLVLARALP